MLISFLELLKLPSRKVLGTNQMLSNSNILIELRFFFYKILITNINLCGLSERFCFEILSKLWWLEGGGLSVR